MKDINLKCAQARVVARVCYMETSEYNVATRSLGWLKFFYILYLSGICHQKMALWPNG